jgi:hypothetical protein
LVKIPEFPTVWREFKHDQPAKLFLRSRFLDKPSYDLNIFHEWTPPKHELHAFFWFFNTHAGTLVRADECTNNTQFDLHIPPQCTIQLKHTVLLDNVFEQLSEILHDPTFEKIRVSITMKPSDNWLIKKYVGLDMDWYSATVFFSEGRDIDREIPNFFSESRDIYRAIETFVLSVRLDQNDSRDYFLYKDYKKSPLYFEVQSRQTSTREIYLYPALLALSFFSYQILPPGWSVREKFSTERKSIIFRGPDKNACDAINIIKRVICETPTITEKPTLLCSKLDRQWEFSPQYPSQPDQYFSPYTDVKCRAPYILDVLTCEMAMIFWQTLPAYVLMWMLEFLPWVRRVPEKQRIDRITQVYQTCRRIVATRTITNKK